MATKKNMTLDGDDRLFQHFRPSRFLDEPVAALLKEGAVIGQRVAVERLDGGTGIAVRSIAARVTPTSARVVSMMPAARVRSIEQGRRPNSTPLKSLEPQIIRWKEAVGIAEWGIVIAKAIRARGVAGRFFMQGARVAVAGQLPGLIARAGRAAQSNWNRLQ